MTWTRGSDDSPEILVLEREREDYRWARRGIERTLAEESQDPAFAAWLANPATGRFLVLDYLQTDLEFIVRNCATEQQLIEVFAGKVVTQLVERRHVPSAALCVSPAIEAKLRQMVDEINAILTGTER